MYKELELNRCYRLYPDGKIVSTMRGERMLKQCDNGIGYKQYYLKSNDGTSKWYKVHRLVAMYYVDNPMNYKEVNHKDGNKSNNNFDNLEWCTHKQNIIHSYEQNGRKIYKGEYNHRFGTKASDETKKKQSEKKKGSNHPKFKGYYCFEDMKFSSSFEASSRTGINSKSIIRWSKAKKNGWNFEGAI